MIIHSAFKDYEVSFEDSLGFFDKLRGIKNTLFVIDRNVYELYEGKLTFEDANPILIDATEENKVVDTALDICLKATEIGAKRNMTLISIGGVLHRISRDLSQVLFTGEFIGYMFPPRCWLRVIAA